MARWIEWWSDETVFVQRPCVPDRHITCHRTTCTHAQWSKSLICWCPKSWKGASEWWHSFLKNWCRVTLSSKISTCLSKNSRMTSSIASMRFTLDVFSEKMEKQVDIPTIEVREFLVAVSSSRIGENWGSWRWSRLFRKEFPIVSVGKSSTLLSERLRNEFFTWWRSVHESVCNSTQGRFWTCPFFSNVSVRIKEHVVNISVPQVGSTSFKCRRFLAKTAFCSEPLSRFSMQEEATRVTTIKARWTAATEDSSSKQL